MSAVVNRTPKKKASNRGSAKEEPIKLQGTVSQKLSHIMYRVALANGHVLLAHPSGRVRQFSIAINPGDTVDLEITPYDLSKGRIVYRH
jgi:translation initiation factor IF-1